MTERNLFFKQNNVILIAEDEECLLEIYQNYLASKNCRSVGFTTAEEAWEYLELNATGIKIVLTDLRLPGEWGSWLAERIKEKFPELPCLLISGTVDLCDLSLFDGVVEKPFLVEELWAEIQRLLNVRK